MSIDNDSEDIGSTIINAGADVLSEVAKAEQEQQRTVQSGLDLVRRAGKFLGGVFGPASIELGHLFGDQMKFWRFKNAVNILEKAQAIIDERGLKPEQVNSLGFGEGLLLLEAASMEEEESVQDMWARLMANAVDPQSATKPEKVYVDILKSLSGREVIFLDLLAKIEEEGTKFQSVAEIDAFAKRMSALAETKWRQFSESECAISIQNLVRLRCATFRAKPIDIANLFAEMPSERGGRSPFGRQWAVVDPDKFQKVLKEVIERQLAASGTINYQAGNTFTMPMGGSFFAGSGRELALPEANFMLTPLGKGLMQACKVEKPPRNSSEPI
jgi:hypothetical protein